MLEEKRDSKKNERDFLKHAYSILINTTLTEQTYKSAAYVKII